MPKGRILKQWEIDKIKKLSSTHYPREIARIIGCTPETVRNLQKDPAMGIVHPKLKIDYSKRKMPTRKEESGYFDIDRWSKLMAV